MSHIGTTPTVARLAINDLSDAVTTAAHIFEAANALFERVSGNIVAMEKWQPGLSSTIGPISGLAWSMSELQGAIEQVRDMVTAMKGAKS